MNKKWNNSALNYEAYFSLEGVSSVHWIVTAYEAYQGMLPEQPQPYTMTDPFLTIGILKINKR